MGLPTMGGSRANFNAFHISVSIGTAMFIAIGKDGVSKVFQAVRLKGCLSPQAGTGRKLWRELDGYDSHVLANKI